MPTTNRLMELAMKIIFGDEDSKLNPISKYAIDKVEIEKKLMKLKTL